MKRLLFPFILTALIASASDRAGFLFVTFKGEQTPMTEQIYFGLSEDGRNWRALNQGEPVFVSTFGEKGLRDPYLLRAGDGKGFFLIATDLSIHLNRDWKRAVEAGSQSIAIWESPDLVNWSEPRLVKVAADDAGCTWAPEAVYDADKQAYLVFWASKTARDQFAKHRIWAAWTKDFRTFDKPFIYIDRDHDVIDTTVVKEDGHYYRFSKDEKFKAVTMETGTHLEGPWTEVPGFSLAKLVGYEGPELYVVDAAKDGRKPTWCLILDHYSKQNGYQPFITHDLAKGEFTAGEGFSFPFKFRHGSILALTDAELARVKAAYDK